MDKQNKFFLVTLDKDLAIWPQYWEGHKGEAFKTKDTVPPVTQFVGIIENEFFNFTPNQTADS